MFAKKTWSALAVAALCGAAHAADNFAHDRQALHTLYPTRASVMQAIALEKDVMLRAEARDANNQPTGRFDFCIDTNCSLGEAGNSQWGVVALLVYWWEKNGRSDAAVADAARRGLAFALTQRSWTDDPSDTSNLRQTGTGHAYARFYLNNCSPLSNYPSTAWSLLYKALILKHGRALLNSSEHDALAMQARSNWMWLTRASKFNPQSATNQAMGSLVGAYLLGDALGDSALKAEALAYYNTGVVATNLPPAGQCGSEPACGGLRNVARTTVQGRKVFNEQGGFDTHYGVMQLSFNAALVQMMGGATDNNVYQDALEQAQYLRDRLSAGGAMHGGTRNNEMAGSNSELAMALGLNYFSAKTNRDLGAARVRYVVIDPNSPTQSMAYGQRAMSILLFHEYFGNWNTNKLDRNTDVGLRRGDVSVFFDASGQPQHTSVAGTSFTEAVVTNGTRARGWLFEKSDGSWVVDSSIHTYKAASTNNYLLRSTSGSPADPNVSVKTRYLTNGRSLYVVSLARFNTPITLRAANWMAGLPHVSATERIVRVSGNGSSLDLSADSGSLAAPQLTAGDAMVEGHPSVAVHNVANAVTVAKARWMTAVNQAGTIQDLGRATKVKPWNPLTCSSPADPGDTPRVWWTPKGSEPSVQFTDLMRVRVAAASGSESYAAGDVIAAVTKISPAGDTSEGFTVLPTYVGGSNTKISKIVVKDQKMTLDLSWSAGTLVDIISGQTLAVPQ